MFNAEHRQNSGRWEALFMHGFHAPHADASHRGAMIGVMTADDDGAAVFALHLPIMAHHAQYGVIGFGAGAVEKHMWQAAAGEAGNLVREHDRWRIRSFEEAVIIRQLKHLFARDLRQFIAAITNGHTP